MSEDQRAREARYAEAIDNLTFAHSTLDADWLDDVTAAVLAVADEEMLGLRAEVEQLRRDVAGQTRSAQNGWRTAEAFRARAKDIPTETAT